MTGIFWADDEARRELKRLLATPRTTWGCTWWREQSDPSLEFYDTATDPGKSTPAALRTRAFIAGKNDWRRRGRK